MDEDLDQSEIRSDQATSGIHDSGKPTVAGQGYRERGAKNSSREQQLLSASRLGDQLAFSALLSSHERRLYNNLYRFLGNHEDAEDVLQETLLKAYVKLDTFRGESAFFTWLYRIAMRLAMSHVRKRRKHGGLVNREGEEIEVQGKEGTPAEALAAKQRADQVHAALGELEPDHRQVLLLRELEGWSYDEIASIIEVPVGTVRSRIYRGRMRLKEILTQWGIAAEEST